MPLMAVIEVRMFDGEREVGRVTEEVPVGRGRVGWARAVNEIGEAAREAASAALGHEKERLVHHS